MSLFGNTNNAQNTLFSNNSTQALSNSSSQNDKDKQGQATSLFGNSTNPQGIIAPSFNATNPQTNTSLFGVSANNSTYNANQTNTNVSFLNTSNQSNIDNKDKPEQTNKTFGTGNLFGANSSGSTGLFGKSGNNYLKPAGGSLLTKATEESTKNPNAVNSGVSSSLFGNAAKPENQVASASASSNLFGGGFKPAEAEANEEKKEAIQKGSTPLFGGTTNKQSNPLCGTTYSNTGNLFGNTSKASNAADTAAENKSASTGLFGTGFGSGFSSLSNAQGGLFGQSKLAENQQEPKEIKTNIIAEKKEEAAKQPINPSGASIFGNFLKANEPVKQGAPITANVSNLFGASENLPTSTASDAKTNLFGAPSKAQPSADVKTNLFGSSGVNLGSSGLFGGIKPTEAPNTTQSASGGANLFAPQTGSNQALFGSGAKKAEEKTEVSKDLHQIKPLFGSVQTSVFSTNQVPSSKANLQSTPKKTEESKSTIPAEETKPNLLKPAEQTSTNAQTNFSNLFGSKDTKTDNKISFGAPTIHSASAQSVSDTNKTIPKFPVEKKDANVINLNKFEKPADSSKFNFPTNLGLSSEADKKLPSEISKLSKPSEPVKEIKIEDLKYNNLMNRTIDETINNWKLELETQTEMFNNNSEKIKQFEFSFLKNYDNIQILNNVIDKIESDTKESIENMKSTSHQEDNIIDELDLIEKGLDKYLEIVSKRVPQEYVDNNYLYQTTLDLDKEIKLMQNEINNVQKTIVNDNEKLNIANTNIEKNTIISYENIAANEIVDIDKNDIESILNGYYNSLKVIQTLQNSIENKIVDIDSDINNIKNRRDYGWS